LAWAEEIRPDTGTYRSLIAMLLFYVAVEGARQVGESPDSQQLQHAAEAAAQAVRSEGLSPRKRAATLTL
jgi:hypothetical protein